MPNPSAPRPKRQQLSCSLTPQTATRLNMEAETRVLAPSVLIERALTRMFTEFDAATAPDAS